jgi:hypothetical protein
VRDEGLFAATAGAAYVSWLMNFRLEVVEEVAFALECPLAGCAVGVYVAIMFLELCVAVECLYHVAGSVSHNYNASQSPHWHVAGGKWDKCGDE